MVRELPLLLGAIGTVLGLFTLPWILFLLTLSYASATDFPLGSSSLSDELFALLWAVSPFLGLAGAFKVKKHGILGGLLFAAAGALPWLGISFSGNFVAFFWTPLLVLAGILAILNWPGPYVNKEGAGDAAADGSIPRA